MCDYCGLSASGMLIANWVLGFFIRCKEIWNIQNPIAPPGGICEQPGDNEWLVVDLDSLVGNDIRGSMKMFPTREFA